ncbi:MAG: cation:proton antiporter [Clostridia bacterium]|jgi:Kef-type K+ transport system membrane component KefB|nr:cation:proton antiporter [Clostridia bacterium]MDD4571978.1 cation:proton antiporter [Clostridia bacterium]
MDNYEILKFLAIILLSTKLLGLLSRKLGMPDVVGAILAGLLIGPSMLGWVSQHEVINILAQLGVITLMYTAGLETDLKEMKKNGVACIVIASFGVLIPFFAGYIVSAFFFDGFNIYSSFFWECIFIGVILTATSVSITVETLKELGKLNSKAGTTILGAAIVDDILGIIMLTVVSGIENSDVQISIMVSKIFLFFIFCGVVGIIFNYLFKYICQKRGCKKRLVVYGFAFCLAMCYIAEHYFGVADITGAYVAGIIVKNTYSCSYILERMEILSFSFLSPIFFASIGIKVTLDGFSNDIIWFSVLLVVLAILSKIGGCWLGAKLCHFSNKDALQVGTGMISRGEVALIVANKGSQLGVLPSILFAPIVLMIIVTTLITPILLKILNSPRFDKNNEDTAKPEALCN